MGGFILSATQMSFALEGRLMCTQGLINPGGDLKKGYLFINEMRVNIDQKTRVIDHQGRLIPISELKPKRWVYMETEQNPSKKMIKATKIYLLPHYVNPKEKQNFSFMK